jgi:O-antigen ligase
MFKISVYVIAYNEAQKVRAAIGSVLWADEVILIDSHSTDGTDDIAQSMGARVVQVDFNGFGHLRNKAIEACSHEWIFSLDADERCTPEVAEEIQQIVRSEHAAHDAYLVPRRNYFMGRRIKYSGWYPNYRQPQLFRKGKMRYDNLPVHEGFILESDRSLGYLKKAIWQFPFKNLAEVMHKSNRYSSLGAEKIKHKKPSMLSALIHATWAFWKHYLFKRGVLDGWPGFVIALGSFEGTFKRNGMRKSRNLKMNSAPVSKVPWNARTLICCFSALTVSLPMAFVSIGKVLLLFSMLTYLVYGFFTKSLKPVINKVTIAIILVSIFIFLLSATYTPVDGNLVLWSMAKHFKILTILAMLLLIQNVTEAKRTLSTLMLAQVIVLLLSLLQIFDIFLPGRDLDAYKYVVFATSYIDQSFMFVMLAAMCWYLAQEKIREQGAKTHVYLLHAISLLALFDVLFLLPGRTGYVAVIVFITVAALLKIPKKWWLPTMIIIPVALGTALYFSDGQTHVRIKEVFTESRNFQKQGDVETSSGFRLNAWHRSLEAIAENPVVGHGIGSWEYVIKKLQGSDAVQVFGPTLTSNPHQEYLLWAVEIGLFGPILLLALFVSIFFAALQASERGKKTLISVVAVAATVCLFNSSLFDDLSGDFICTTLGALLAFCAYSPKKIIKHDV